MVVDIVFGGGQLRERKRADDDGEEKRQAEKENRMFLGSLCKSVSWGGDTI